VKQLMGNVYGWVSLAYQGAANPALEE